MDYTTVKKKGKKTESEREREKRRSLEILSYLKNLNWRSNTMHCFYLLNKHLQGTFNEPDTALSVLEILTHLILTITKQ